MLPSPIWKGLQASVEGKAAVEILALNDKTKRYGLALTPDDVQRLLVARSQALQNYGRVELGIEVSKALVEGFASSPYISEENFVSVLTELHDVFYYMKNETEDKVSDPKLIGMMREYFDGPCGGSIDVLKDKLQVYAETFRKQLQSDDLMSGGIES